MLDSIPITDPFIRNWLDLLSFLLSGLPADGTIAAEVAFMFNEVGWFHVHVWPPWPAAAGTQDLLGRSCPRHTHDKHTLPLPLSLLLLLLVCCRCLPSSGTVLTACLTGLLVAARQWLPPLSGVLFGVGTLWSRRVVLLASFETPSAVRPTI